MNESMRELADWLERLHHFQLPNWDALPELDLYMDQVITYMDQKLSPLSVEPKEKMITNSMINNYVKGELLSSPIQKKYSKDHLGYMFAIFSIKQVLSIGDIATLFQSSKETNQSAQELYRFFQETQSEMIQQVASETKILINQFLESTTDSESNHIAFLNQFVFKLAIEAEVKKIIANKMIYLLSQYEKSKKSELERIEKEKIDPIKTEKKPKPLKESTK